MVSMIVKVTEVNFYCLNHNKLLTSLLNQQYHLNHLRYYISPQFSLRDEYCLKGSN